MLVHYQCYVFRQKLGFLLFTSINIFMHGSFMAYFHFHGQLSKSLFSYLNLKRRLRKKEEYGLLMAEMIFGKSSIMVTCLYYL